MVNRIATAISRNLLKLDIRHDYQRMLPLRIFTCKTLTELRLDSCVGLPCNNDAVFLPNLEKLHLSYIEYQLEEVVPRLLSGCPVLEDLTIHGLVDEGLDCCDISSPTIKRLTLNFASDSCEFENPDYRVYINAPQLRYLKVHDCSYKHISVLPATMTSLTQADICLNVRENYDLENDCYTSDVVRFLDRLCNVTCLTLSGCYEEKFIDLAVAGSIVKFDNLIKLKLELAADWRFIFKFLEIADNLEVLIVSQVDVNLTYWKEEPEQVPKCLSLHLKSIRIDRMMCVEHEFNVVKYLLRNALVLEGMKIYFIDTIDLTVKSDAIKQFSLFEKGSKACNLDFD